MPHMPESLMAARTEPRREEPGTDEGQVLSQYAKEPAQKRSFPWWIILGALLLPCVYLPTLATPFDFIDDGDLVYPQGPMPLAQRLGIVWQKITANYEHLGPFRPVLWLHWETEAELLGANAFSWRLARLAWMILATGALLWLLHELNISRGAALFATALAMWCPYRNEIWTSLTLSEGVAMPYALMGLVCALRAARSVRPWKWDVLGMVCVLAALGCKNTFAAVVPAQCLLRLAPEGRDFAAGWKRNGIRAGLLSLTLVAPLAHYVIFKLSWHPGQYLLPGASMTHLGRQLRSLAGAVSLEYLGVGFGLTILALVFATAGHQETDSARPPSAWSSLWQHYRGALLAGPMLVTCGVAIYLPIGAISGRYTMPAVWGMDLWIAALLTALAGFGSQAWKRTAQVVLACGLAAVMVANLGRQDKFAARAKLLWQVVEYVEQHAPESCCIAWQSGDQLNLEEGIHFQWHLHNRTRPNVMLELVDVEGRTIQRVELSESQKSPILFVTASATVAQPWHLIREFRSSYWAGRRNYVCYLHAMPAADNEIQTLVQHRD